MNLNDHKLIIISSFAPILIIIFYVVSGAYYEIEYTPYYQIFRYSFLATLVGYVIISSLYFAKNKHKKNIYSKTKIFLYFSACVFFKIVYVIALFFVLIILPFIFM